MEIPKEEVWNLDVSLGKFLLPRLKLFKLEAIHAVPYELTAEEWETSLDELIALAEFLENEGLINISRDSIEYVKYEERMKLLTHHLPDLWT